MFFSPIHKGKLEEEIWISALAWSLCPPSPNSYVEPLISDKLVSRDDNFGTYTVIWVEPSWMEIVSYRKRCQRAQIFSICFLLCGDTRRNCLQSSETLRQAQGDMQMKNERIKEWRVKSERMKEWKKLCVSALKKKSSECCNPLITSRQSLKRKEIRA